MKKIMPKFNSKMTGEVLGSLVLLALFILPVLSFAGSDSKIYVDDNASGKQDGSKKNPFRTINSAIKKADEGDEIHIRPGKYKENIDIPKGVEVYGSDKDEVIIKADDDDYAVVDMNHKTKIGNVTIKDGEVGIRVGKSDRASISECIIKDNEEDGIKIRTAKKINDKYKVSVSDSLIVNNGRSGIFSEKRKLVIVNNYIADNDSDGIDIAGGSEAWIEDNKIKYNESSGTKLTLDGSEIWIKDNTYRDNDREGVEINAYGGNGKIKISKSKLYRNERYGVARIKRGGFSNAVFNGIEFKNTNTFWENEIGAISGIIPVY